MMNSESVKTGSGLDTRGGFTMIELMVVVAIIIMATGIMGPTIADFMKNRQLEGVRGQFGNIFNMARLQAVNQRRDISVVFFREGPRVFDELRSEFIDNDVWYPGTSPLGEKDPAMWYALGFARGTTSYNPKHDEPDFVLGEGLSVPPFEKWKEKNKSATSGTKRSRSARRSSRSRRTSSGRARPATTKYRVNGLFKVTFNRNGTLVFSNGCSDVPTSIYNNEENGGPRTADLVILQLDATPACFIDMRPTGQVRSKTVSLAKSPKQRGDVSAVGMAASGSRRLGRKKSGR